LLLILFRLKSFINFSILFDFNSLKIKKIKIKGKKEKIKKEKEVEKYFPKNNIKKPKKAKIPKEVMSIILSQATEAKEEWMETFAFFFKARILTISPP